MAKILIVDDREINRDLLTTLLSYRKHELFEACDGNEGLNVARQVRPDLILSDVLMPTMDGFEFVRRLRADHEIGNTPVVFTSAHYLTRESEALARACRVSAVLPKPCEPEKILEVVDSLLSNSDRPEPQVIEETEFSREHLKILTDKLAEKADSLRAANAKLSALFEFSRDMISERDPRLLTDSCSRISRQVIGSKWSATALLDEETGHILDVSVAGLEHPWSEDLRKVSNWVQFSSDIRNRNIIRMCSSDFLSSDVRLPTGFPEAGSLLAVAVAGDGKCLGWLLLADKLGGSEFSEEDEQLAVTIASQLQVAYQNAILCRNLSSERGRLENIIDTVPGVVFEAWGRPDKSTQSIDFVSEYVEQMAGYSIEEWLAEPNFWLTIIHPEDREEAARIGAEAFRSGRKGSHEFHWIRKDGQAIWVSAYFVTVLNENGQPVGTRGVCIDVTERKLAELALKEREGRLRQAQKMEAVGELAGGVAHDFNNLMTVVIGYSDLSLHRILPDDPVRPHLRQIKSAAEKASVLTRQLLAFSRKQILQPSVIDLNNIVLDSERLLGRLISEDIELVTTVEDELWNVKADPGQIEQVVMNLVINARDAMPNGGTVVVETANVELDSQYADTHISVVAGEYVMLAVSDTGVGMDEETQSHIFEPFFTTKGRGKGTGLGLSTVYGIVKQSGGYIWVYSEIGLGTTFKIYLPRVAEAVRHIETAAPSDVRLDGPETILLVDDEEMIRNLAREILTAYGYTVIDATDGFDAILKCQEHGGAVDLLLTDVIMPDIGGSELQVRLKQLRPELKSLFMSGYTDDVVARQGFLDPNVPFIQKPFTPNSLLRKVREALS